MLLPLWGILGTARCGLWPTSLALPRCGNPVCKRQPACLGRPGAGSLLLSWRRGPLLTNNVKIVVRFLALRHTASVAEYNSTFFALAQQAGYEESPLLKDLYIVHIKSEIFEALEQEQRVMERMGLSYVTTHELSLLRKRSMSLSDPRQPRPFLLLPPLLLPPAPKRHMPMRSSPPPSSPPPWLPLSIHRLSFLFRWRTLLLPSANPPPPLARLTPLDPSLLLRRDDLGPYFCSALSRSEKISASSFAAV